MTMVLLESNRNNSIAANRVSDNTAASNQTCQKSVSLKRGHPQYESSVASTASSRQMSISSFFSVLSNNSLTTAANAASDVSCPSTPPSPFSMATPQTPPSPRELNLGTPETEATEDNADNGGTPPSPIHLSRRKKIKSDTTTPFSKNPSSIDMDDDAPHKKTLIRVQSANMSLFETPQSTPPNSLGPHECSLPSRFGQPKKSLQQLYLDLGQESFGKRTICSTCGMLFVHGLAEDSQQHQRVCAEHIKGVPFQSPSARVVNNYADGSKIVEVRSTDSYALRQKVLRIKKLVDQELGFASTASDETVQKTAYLYIINNRAVGMVTAEIISIAHRLENNLERSLKSYKAMVGIHQLWVHNKSRKLGVATKLVDAVRSKLIFGLVAPHELVAFSSPTEAGANFARKYMNTFSERVESSSVLVYDCR